jgi:hypothetical protein
MSFRGDYTPVPPSEGGSSAANTVFFGTEKTSLPIAGFGSRSDYSAGDGGDVSPSGSSSHYSGDEPSDDDEKQRALRSEITFDTPKHPRLLGQSTLSLAGAHSLPDDGCCSPYDDSRTRRRKTGDLELGGITPKTPKRDYLDMKDPFDNSAIEGANRIEAPSGITDSGAGSLGGCTTKQKLLVCLGVSIVVAGGTLIFLSQNGDLR